MARRYKPDYIGKIFDEIEGQNDRAAIIVGLSLVEHFLNEALETKLPPLTKRERADLFPKAGSSLRSHKRSSVHRYWGSSAPKLAASLTFCGLFEMKRLTT